MSQAILNALHAALRDRMPGFELRFEEDESHDAWRVIALTRPEPDESIAHLKARWRSWSVEIPGEAIHARRHEPGELIDLLLDRIAYLSAVLAPLNVPFRIGTISPKRLQIRR
jgi:hypothetical protein